ncbi:MAG TPA: ASKHA domain-containing protein [Solirubrobacteraceae bacterium]|nr:ASKHA domain-containing protein [Solirubrobacteraceae bacterium]
MPGKSPERGREARRAAGRTLFDEADELSLQVPTSCRRTGRCRECVVEVTAGAEHLSPPSPPESFLRPPFRLACQAEPHPPDAAVEFQVVRRRLRIVTPEPERRTAPVEPMVRAEGGVVRWGDEEIERLRGGVHGLAIDVGTTTVVLELVDLQSGRTLELVALENPQRFGGSDVMNRISYDSGPGRGELRHSLRKALNHELRALYGRHGIDRREVYEIVVVGNSTMRDIFFGLDVAPIGERPYKSTTELELLEGARPSTELVALAHELGLWSHPQARVWGAPLVAGHVGADVAADLIAAGFVDRSGAGHARPLAHDGDRPDGVTMLVDVGTNTEVVLAGRGRMLAASCPAGPAFEGGEVTYGMQAGEGAIESVRTRPDGSFDCDVIGAGEARGLCGSGLVDLLAELRRSGRMTPKGVFADRAREVAVVPEAGITLSRADGSALAQAKAANSVGQQVLLRELGVGPGEIDRLYLAGGFARYVDVPNAVEIGFLAPVPAERVVKLGNASLAGARELLLSVPARRELELLIRGVEHMELETAPDFFDLFVDGCQFKPLPGSGTGDGSLAA